MLPPGHQSYPTTPLLPAVLTNRLPHPLLPSSPLPQHDLPYSQRKCTDVCFLIVLVAYWVGALVIMVYSASTAGPGGPAKMWMGVQVDGKVCGMAEPDGPGVTYNKQWYYASASLSTDMICVVECPGSLAAASVTDPASAQTCGRAYDNATGAFRDFCKSKPALGTEVLVNGLLNLCTDVSAAASTIATSQSMFDVSSILMSLSSTWWVMLLSAIFGLVLAFTFLGMVRCGGRFMVYIFLVLTLLIFVGLGVGSFLMQSVSTPADCLTAGATDAFTNGLGLNMTCTCDASGAGGACTAAEGGTYLAAAIVLWIVGGVVFLVMCFMHGSLKVASAVMAEGGHVLGDLKQMFLIPFYKYLVILLFLLAWCGILVFILSGSPLASDGTVAASTSLVGGSSYSVTRMKMETQWGLLLYHLFLLLWTVQLIKASMDFIIGVAVSSWYFADTDPATGKRVPKSKWPVCHGIAMVFRYHLGSLAFGSFLVAVIQLIRIIVEYVDRKTKTAQDKNKLAKAAMCMCKCCLWCLECCMKFITRQAYLMMAIVGENFCFSAKKMFYFSLRNVAKVGITHGVAGVVVFFGKVFCVGMSTFFCYLIITQTKAVGTSVEPLFPVLMCAFIAYIVASVILTLFSTTTEALLLCFLVDNEKNNGNTSHAPDSLRQCLDKHGGGEDKTGGALTYEGKDANTAGTSAGDSLLS